MARFRDVLSNKNFLLLWIGQLISNFGDRLTQMALVALVYQRSPGSEVALAKLISFTIIPVFIIGPIAGVWSDRLNRQQVMIMADLIRGVLILLIPFCIYADCMPPVYLIIFLSFALSRFFIPSKMAIIPDIVPKESLLVANTLQGTTHMIGNVVGLVVAGVIVNMPRIGAIGGFYIDGATFFLSALLIMMMTKEAAVKGLGREIAATGEALRCAIRRPLLTELREGLGHLMRYRDMRFVVWAFFVLMAGLGAISCVIIVFVQEAYGSATRDIGFFGMWLVVGLFAGTVFYGKFCQRWEKRLTACASFAATGAAVLVFTFVVGRRGDVACACAVSCMLGAAASPLMILTNTLTHETIPEEVRGRIFSSLEVVIHLSFLVFMFAAAYAARLVGRYWVLVIVGMVFLLAGIGGFWTEGRRATSSSSLRPS